MEPNKLDPALLLLLDAPRSEGESAEVFVELVRPATPLQAELLEDMGVRVRPGRTLLTGTVPWEQLSVLAEQPNIKRVRATHLLRPLTPQPPA